MQTFLPYADYTKSALSLDRRRLGKQRVEVLQILGTLTGHSIGWRNHPTVKMWQDNIPQLVSYGKAVCDVWASYGYKDTCKDKILHLCSMSGGPAPAWLGDARLHASHRANLLRKDSVWYKQFGWTEDPTMPYYWPT